ncbi:MAG: acetylglutamate kinase [Candidatus Cloacimonetes bacterium]|nr:acetylglutamate kinase [Candidatus Cloacimonadota bacterium]
MSVRVVKIGGAALTDGSWLGAFADAVAAAADDLVIVHGGGPEISALSERLGVAVEWVDGRRVTPDAALDAASMVLNGRVNKRLVSALITAGADAIGLSGEDGGLITAEVAAGGALGRVGHVGSVRSALLSMLIGAGMVPVIAPISRGPGGVALNVNADEVACAVAVAMGARELLFVTDVDGVRDADGITLSALDPVHGESLLASGVAGGGMAVKLRAALDALARGVAQVRIGSIAALVNSDAGTLVGATAVEAA